MYRSKPVGSRVCYDKMQQRQYEMHLKKLNSIKPSVDNKSPPRFKHMELNLKRAQVEEERYASIERDNRRLLQRMTDIMTTQPMPQAGGPAPEAPSPPGPKSLNKEYRKKQLMKITEENSQILRRIQSRRPYYNHLEWEDEFRRNEELVKSIQQVPPSSSQSHRRPIHRRMRVVPGSAQAEHDDHMDEQEMRRESARMRAEIDGGHGGY
jgi:E3 ubiquitin-protein ligase TRIP12